MNNKDNIFKASIHNLGRIMIKDKVTGNNLFSFQPAETVAEFLKKNGLRPKDIDIEWHPEEYEFKN